MSDDYCDLCDLPLSTCVHGMPAPPPEPVKPPPRQRAPRRTVTSRATPADPVRRMPRKWTSPEALAPHIVSVLREAGGELEAEELFSRLEEHLGDTLLEGDHERTPEGELRWRYAARRARQGLISEGVLASGRPGVWELARR